ncbi:MAG: VOC family protein [Caldisericales bacterium]|nr:VOC family protein [Caldisericia bacterium]NMD14861.1 VOC family protein [Caldisericales bacterium]
MTEFENEIYAMPCFATLSVNDVASSVDFYCDKLGFMKIFFMEGPSGETALAHLRWAMYADLLVVPGKQEAADQKGFGISLTFACGRVSVDELAERLAKAGLEFSGPTITPWNAKELRIKDPDGFLLVFTEQADSRKDFDEVIGDIKKAQG